MIKIISTIVFLIITIFTSAQKNTGSIDFWNQLQKHCGVAYEGVVEAGMTADFKDKKLVMHVLSCSAKEIRVPFFVGENKSRTWVFKIKGQKISLKHDHRHEDGSADSVTQYGGTATNFGLANLQIFPADQATQNTIPAATGNVWWVTLDNAFFTYNLRRVGTERIFTVKFDLSKPIQNASKPWGWKG